MKTARRSLEHALFFLPAGILLVVFLVYPFIMTVRMSLDTGVNLKLTKFIGLDNFKRLLGDHFFIDLGSMSGALVNNVLWLVLYTGCCIGLGLFIAVLADRVRYEKTVKAILFAPQAISATAAGVIWLFVFAPEPNLGVLNGALRAFGIDPIGWLGQPSTVNFAIIAAAVWSGTGLVVVILSAAIKGVPEELIEAATIDGATPFQVFRKIVLPMIAIPLSVVVVTLAIGVIKVFDIVYIMTRGGPAGSSRVIAYSYYVETFTGGRGGYGAAAAVVMVLLIIPIMAFNIQRFRLDEGNRDV